MVTGAALTVRPVKLEPHQYLRFTNRDHFLKSPKNAVKINPKNMYPLEPHQYFRACAATEMVIFSSSTECFSKLFSLQWRHVDS